MSAKAGYLEGAWKREHKAEDELYQLRLRLERSEQKLTDIRNTLIEE